DPSVLAHRAGNVMWFVVAFGVLWCGAGIALTLRRRVKLDIALAQMLAGALFGAVALGRLYSVPGLGLRAGWLIAFALAAAPFAPRIVRQALRDGLPADCLRAAAFAQPEAHAWSALSTLAWLGLHLLGSMAVLSIIKQPVWFALVILALILAPQISAALLQRASAPQQSQFTNLKPVYADLQWQFPRLAVLSPLLFVYGVLGLRLIVGLVARITLGQFRVVEPFGALLDLPLSLVVLSAYALVASLYQATLHPQSPDARLQSRSTFVRMGALTLVIGVIAWAGWNALTMHTQGVTGSDPYAYAQMGVDLADHGTVAHSFPLIRLTYALNIPSEPIIHVGYRLPQNVERMATTVWPPGYAVITAIGYKAGGEQGLYLITPLFSLLSLAVVWILSYRLARDAELGQGSFAAAALAVFLTATSYQQIEWQLIPMADIATQAFSLLALYAALRAHSGRGLWIGAFVSGLALGLAFDMRYTQVLLAPALAYALFTLEGRPARSLMQRLKPVLASGVAAWVAVTPMLIYHMLAFGNPFYTGSEELANFSLARLPETLARITGELISLREFGLLLPLIVIGLLALWRCRRRSCVALTLYFVPLFLFHITYAYLRPRDILFLFPILSSLAVIGAVWLVSRLWLARQTLLVMGTRAALLGALSFVFIVRSQQTLELPITHGFALFGYLVSEQRASFTRLSELTPADAVIGCSLNSG
ncbi:MAG TPA: glycosyltransferase family 39 protein, partial [Anaerolineae bacterium]